MIPVFNVTETLFGGLLLATALFFAARKLGLSGFWAGILSGTLPFLLYVAYSSQHWAGGDVLTIHFAVFLAAAGLLMVFGSMQDKKQGMHWAPKIIVAFFIALVLLNAVLLSISSRGLPDTFASWFLPNPNNQKVHTVFPGVVPHDRNKSYQPHLERLERQQNLGWAIDGWDSLKKIKAGQSSLVTIRIFDKQKQPIQGAAMVLGMWRMADSMDDRQIVFKETEAGVYQATINLPDEGRWFAELNIERGDDSYQKQQQLLID